MSTIIEQNYPYDISHRGSRDQARHNKRVQEAVKKQLKDIISGQDIITSDGNRKVKIRLKYLDQYRFIYNKDQMDEVGRDEFDDLNEGEVIYRPNQGGVGLPNKPGKEGGDQVFEAEYTIEELTDMMLADLELPDLDDNKKNEIVSEVLEWNDRRKQTGIQALLDKKQTILASIKRRKMDNDPNSPSIMNEDLRFKTWSIEKEKHSNAVIFLIMDRSGSMSENKIYAVKALYFWIVQFLKRRYDKVDIRFIAHDVRAQELQEADFFSIVESGGTLSAPAHELCRDIIKHSYPSSQWNIYCFYTSDGDAYGDDIGNTMSSIKDLVDLGVKLYAYTEVQIESYRDGTSDLYNELETLCKVHYQVIGELILELADIHGVLKRFLRHSTRTAHGK